MTELDEAERTAVERMLAFANLGKVEDAETVYAIFEPPADAPKLAILRNEGQDKWVVEPLLFQKLTRDTPAEAARKLNADLAKVDPLLLDFDKSPTKARKLHSDAIAKLVAKGALAALPGFKSGHLVTRLHFHSSGVEASAGYGLALLYDKSKPYGDALKRCKLESCDKWFLSFARGAGGRLPNYCCVEHQREADKVRAVKRADKWRKEQKKAKQLRAKQ